MRWEMCCCVERPYEPRFGDFLAFGGFAGQPDTDDTDLRYCALYKNAAWRAVEPFGLNTEPPPGAVTDVCFKGEDLYLACRRPDGGYAEKYEIFGDYLGSVVVKRNFYEDTDWTIVCGITNEECTNSMYKRGFLQSIRWRGDELVVLGAFGTVYNHDASQQVDQCCGIAFMDADGESVYTVAPWVWDGLDATWHNAWSLNTAHDFYDLGDGNFWMTGRIHRMSRYGYESDESQPICRGITRYDAENGRWLSHHDVSNVARHTSNGGTTVYKIFDWQGELTILGNFTLAQAGVGTPTTQYPVAGLARWSNGEWLRWHINEQLDWISPPMTGTSGVRAVKTFDTEGRYWWFIGSQGGESNNTFIRDDDNTAIYSAKTAGLAVWDSWEKEWTNPPYPSWSFSYLYDSIWLYGAEGDPNEPDPYPTKLGLMGTSTIGGAVRRWEQNDIVGWWRIGEPSIIKGFIWDGEEWTDEQIIFETEPTTTDEPTTTTTPEPTTTTTPEPTTTTKDTE